MIPRESQLVSNKHPNTKKLTKILCREVSACNCREERNYRCETVEKSIFANGHECEAQECS